MIKAEKQSADQPSALASIPLQANTQLTASSYSSTLLAHPRQGNLVSRFPYRATNILSTVP